MPRRPPSGKEAAPEGFAPVEDGQLFYRVVGEGRPIVVVHGGPDFDHSYLLPDMDRLADAYRLIYYDQRGVGKSTGRTGPGEVTIRRYVEDLEGLRRHLGLNSVILLGHSWGGRLAMEYALRYPARVSHLILMNTIYASRQDGRRVMAERARRLAACRAELDALRASPEYARGDPAAVEEYYRTVYGTCTRRPEDLAKLNLTFTRHTILAGRENERLLFDEVTFAKTDDLLSRLRTLPVPSLLLHGDYDLIVPDVVAHIAGALPRARLVVLKDCGHFAYIEAPDKVRRAVADFLDGTPARPRVRRRS